MLLFVLYREAQQELECHPNITGVESAEVGSEVTTSNSPLMDELINKLQEPFSDAASISSGETDITTKKVDAEHVNR